MDLKEAEKGEGGELCFIFCFGFFGLFVFRGTINISILLTFTMLQVLIKKFDM